ncbi:unnamed protein product [Albugo candida]|uniref:Uncharacterized protein n=1 Tax=Albugo candida TaxID=65357 RepID=A0A024FUI0_9STRA|nr:unnamed protein product [Albugo candida]|eukprot:CCI10314.1 unnamed protein product [Albugo candida]
MCDREFFFLLERAFLPTEHANVLYDRKHYTSVRVEDIYKQLQNVDFDRKTFFFGGCDCLAEILTRLAEAAIHQRNYDTAQKAVSWFLRDIRLRNQLHCRILFAQAICHVNLSAEGKSGVPKIRAIMEAIEYVLQVVEFALQKQNRPRYDFLVYNSSMIYWRIARSLMKVKTIRFLISSLTTIIDALKIVSEADILWVARLKVTLAQAFIDDGQNACAAQFTAEVVEKMLLPFYIDTAALNKISSEGKREAHRLFQDALILQHYFSTINEPECRKLSITAANNATQFSTKLESKHYMVLLRLETLKFTGQAEDVSKELCQIFIESTGLKDYEASTISRKGLKAHCKITAAGSNVAISADDQLVVEIGIFALSRGIFDVAVHCEAVVKMSMDEVTPHLLLLHRFLCTMLHIECDELYAAFNQKVPRGKPHSMDKVKWMNKLLTYCARMQCK